MGPDITQYRVVLALQEVEVVPYLALVVQVTVLSRLQFKVITAVVLRDLAAVPQIQQVAVGVQAQSVRMLHPVTRAMVVLVLHLQ